MTTENTVKAPLPVWQTVVNAIVAMDKAEGTHRNAVCALAMAYRGTGLDGADYVAINKAIVDGLGKRMKIEAKEATRRANPILRMAYLATKADLDLGATKDGKLILPSVASIREAAFLKVPSLKTKRGKPAGSKNKKTVEKATAVANKTAGEKAAVVNSAEHRFNSSTERERFYNTLTPEALALDFKVIWALMLKRSPDALGLILKDYHTSVIKLLRHK